MKRSLPYSSTPANIKYAEIVYESPTTIVFKGDLVAEFGFVLNTGIWSAVDLLKGEGYQLNQIINTGAGSEANPHTLYVIMSKPVNSTSNNE